MDGAQLGLDELGLGFAPRRLVRVTPSRLATWDDCPRRYRLVYVDRPTPARGGATAHKTIGAVVHLALRSVFGLPARRRTADAAAALVDRHWPAADATTRAVAVRADGFRDAAQAAHHRERAQAWLAGYVADLDRDGAAEPVGVERWVSTATERIVAEGRVDRIDERGGELVIVDYKTGRRVPCAADARDSRALALYAVAVTGVMRRPCRRVELHHVPSGEVLAWEHDVASLQSHVRAAEATAVAAAEASASLAADATAAEVDALFPPRPAPRCGSCDVRRHCPEGRAAATEPAPWSLLAP